MAFSPTKSELLHFTRARQAPTDTVKLEKDFELAPAESARFLGIWLDRKLTFQAHINMVKTKLKNQSLALTKLTAKTWGCSVPWARKLYMTVVRSTIAYGAAVFHTPTPRGATRPIGPALQLEEEQTKCARIVTGAYRSTPAHIIQTEVGIPPLDLYLDQRAASFLPRQGYRDKSYQICHRVFNATRPRGGYHRATASNNPATTHDHILMGWTQETTLKEWKDRWRKATTDRRSTAASLDPAWSGKEIRWFIQSGRLPEYRLATEWGETTPNPGSIGTNVPN